MVHPQSEILAHQAVVSGELEIDTEGRVWRVKKRTFDRWTGGTKTTACPRVRAELANGSGYLQVRVMRDGKRAYAAAHRLVWIHFNGPIPAGATINHKDGKKDNNTPANLELASCSDQRHHAIQALGARHWDCKGANHPKTELTEQQVLEIRRRRKDGEMVKSIAAHFKMKTRAVSAICNRRTWKHIP